MADADLIYGDYDPNAPARNINPPPGSNIPPPTLPFGGWNAGNVFDSWDLNPLAQQTGVSRDDLSLQRDAFLQPLFSQYRSGAKSDQGDLDLFNNPQFRTFAQGGQLPTIGRSPLPPNQFDDPYTTQLETIAKAQMGETRNNPGLNQLLSFLDTQFQDLSQHPGFSPQEMATLNTQAFEPIEAMRKASTERSLQRTANRGFLPSSGLAELDLRQIDLGADKLRAQAGRDLAINAIDRRDQDLNRALGLATTRGLTIPQGQRAEELDLSNLLYGLPRNALQDALAVLNGSPSSTDLLGGAQASAYQQQLERQRNQEMWAQIAQFIAGLGI